MDLYNTTQMFAIHILLLIKSAEIRDVSAIIIAPVAILQQWHLKG
jgi:hypothetical protein